MATLAGFTIGAVIWEIPVGWKAALMSVVYGIPIVVAAFLAGVQLAPRIRGAREARAEGTPDCQQLGVTHVVRRREADVRFPAVQLLESATTSILVAAYAPRVLNPYQNILINKAQQVPPVKVTLVLPNPRNRQLMARIDRFGEGSGTYAFDLASSLSMLKGCWSRVSDKAAFRVFLTNALSTFTAMVVDDSKGSIQVTAHGWSADERLLLRVRDGPLLRQCLRSCEDLIRAENLAQEVTSLEEFDAVIPAPLPAGGSTQCAR